jgi:hypothetical protein
MSFVRCEGCHTPAGCGEYGACLNTVVICHNTKQRHQQGAPAPADRALMVGRDYTGAPASAHAPAPVAATTPARPAAAPPSAPRAPGGGSVTERIFAACEAALVELGQGGTLDAARKLAIPRLEAAGVNANSARKGSSMWVQSRR